MDTIEFKIDETVNKSIGNIVLSCRSKLNICTPEEFINDYRYSIDFISVIRKIKDKFKSDAGIESEE